MFYVKTFFKCYRFTCITSCCLQVTWDFFFFKYSNLYCFFLFKLSAFTSFLRWTKAAGAMLVGLQVAILTAAGRGCEKEDDQTASQRWCRLSQREAEPR